MSNESDNVIAAIASLRADGPHAVRLRMRPDALNSRLKVIARWLIDWQMPHAIRLSGVDTTGSSVIEFRFPDERHARAFKYQFQNEAL